MPFSDLRGASVGLRSALQRSRRDVGRAGSGDDGVVGSITDRSSSRSAGEARREWRLTGMEWKRWMIQLSRINVAGRNAKPMMGGWVRLGEWQVCSVVVGLRLILLLEYRSLSFGLYPVSCTPYPVSAKVEKEWKRFLSLTRTMQQV